MTKTIFRLFGVNKYFAVPDSSTNKAEAVTADELSMQNLASRVQRLEDTLEIQQLQSQYAYWLLTQNYDKIIEHSFAHHADGILIEFSDSGVYKGIEGVRRIFTAFAATREIPGFFTLHMTVNPYIVIAADGQSAKSTWLSPGAASSSAGARWIWGPYYVDYVRENGQWRIRSTIFAPLFRNRYETSWVEETDHGSVKGPFAKSPPDEPPTRYRPYDPQQKSLFEDYPELPEPY